MLECSSLLSILAVSYILFPDYHYEEDDDGNLVLAAGEKTPGGVAKEVTATLKTLLHYLTIQEGRQTFYAIIMFVRKINFWNLSDVKKKKL